MLQLLSYLSCCLLIANALTLLPKEPVYDYDYTELPIDLPVELPIDAPIAVEDDLMTANRVNWLIHAQGQDKDRWRVRREVENVQQSLESTSVPSVPIKSTTEQNLPPVLITKVPVKSTTEQNLPPVLITEVPKMSTSEQNLSPVLITEVPVTSPIHQITPSILLPAAPLKVYEPSMPAASTPEKLLYPIPITERPIKLPEPPTITPRLPDACPTNAQRGLTALIRNVRALLPVEELRNILANAREDPEVRELIKLVRSEQFMERVERLRNTKPQIALRNSLCQDLKLNHAYYVEFLRVFLNMESTEKPTKPSSNRRKGIRGLLLELRSVLPRGEIRELFRRQLGIDKELSQAVRRIRSSEFRRLLNNVREQKEYRSIRAELEKVGVPVQQALSLVSSALGWGNLEIGSEIDIMVL